MGGPPSLGRRGSRFTTPSPLLAKSGHMPRLSRVSSFEIMTQPHILDSGQDDELPEFDDPEMGMRGASETTDFELYVPAAPVPSQQAAQSQWMKETLEKESHNFLLFLDARINEQIEATEDIDSPAASCITLDELLPPSTNTQMVAAQALLHVLALATKDLIEVIQTEVFGQITLRIKGQVIVEGKEDRSANI